MGTNLFYYLLDFDFTLVWICSQEADIDKIRKTFLKKIKRSLDNNLVSQSRFETLQKEVTITKDIAELATCELIIETIFENASLKRRLFKAIDPIVPVSTILATSSSSVNPCELLPACIRKRSFIGLHFFYPVALKNIVEFIVTDDTSWQTQETVEKFLQAINRKYMILNEKDGHILNRIFLDFQNEAFLIATQENHSFREMDRIVRKYFFPTGAFEFMDSVGIDIMLASVKNYVRTYPHKDYYLPLIHHLEKMVSEGKTGMKASEGFFSYPPEQGTSERGRVLDNDPVDEEIRKRLSFTYISAVKRFAAQSKCNIQDLNDAIREYFGIDNGPLDIVS